VLKKSLARAAVAAVAAVGLAGCGGQDDSMGDMAGMGSSSSSSSPSSSQSADFNDADVSFATDMIPHHRQAVEMAKLAASRAESAEVKDLAKQIEDAQDPEIQMMTAWLQTWGAPVPEDGMSGMSGMDHGSGSMSGMMSNEDMDSLMNSSGPEFDTMFLTMMIAHHKGAIEMARTEQAKGSSADAVALAKQIEQAQTKEIATMQSLLQ
jgi:uncharacterized protein (DUF305 family)